MNLTLITKKFPYFTTEAFLESEISYLKDAFDQVVFLPIIKGKVRKSYENAYIVDTYNELYKHKFIQFIKVLFSKHFYFQLIHLGSKIFKINNIERLANQDIHYRILKKVIIQNPPLFTDDSIVYCYWFSSSVYAVLKLRKDMGLNFKVVCRAHRYDVYDEAGEMPNRAFCIENINQIYPISQDAIDTFTRKYGHAEKFTLARLGVANYNKINEPSGPGVFHVLTVSQTSKRKRIRTILYSLQEFAKKYGSVKIIWTHFGDGPLDGMLMQEKNNNAIANFEIEIKGRVPNTEIINYYQNEPIDVFVNLSESEGVPVSVMEAHSFGVPVIATNVGGTSEIMDPANGVLLSSNPNIFDIVKAYTFIYEKCLDRNKIKLLWNEKSNSEIVFPEFIKKLKNIQ